MTDRFGRSINYLRISITDQCNLRCRYCMPPEGVAPAGRERLMSCEEILAAARAAAGLSIDRFKITGGEPLLRPDCAEIICEMKKIPGVRQVTLTTNGILLPERLKELLAAGVDAVNISLDTLDDRQFSEITRGRCTAGQVLQAVRLCSGQVPTRINAVLLPETRGQLIPLARLAETLPVDVRFIEQMPIGEGARRPAESQKRESLEAPAGSVLARLKEEWPNLSPLSEKRGNGPARYFSAPCLKGNIGLIEAVSHSFCSECNRMRLTCTGVLKPCLCYGEGVDLMPVLRPKEPCVFLPDRISRLQAAIESAVLQKPAAHCFDRVECISERKSMSQIGG